MNSSKNYEKVKFVNLSISSLGVFSHSSLDFTKMLKDPKFDEQCRKYYVRRIINICIRSSYYIFCKRNKEWDNPFYIYILYMYIIESNNSVSIIIIILYYYYYYCVCEIWMAAHLLNLDTLFAFAVSRTDFYSLSKRNNFSPRLIYLYCACT